MLSGLFNGVFLIFVAFNVFIESVERIYEPQHIQGGSLLMVSVLGLLVNLVGLVFFHEHAHGGGECQHDHGHVEEHTHVDRFVEEHTHEQVEALDSETGEAHSHDHS